MGDGAASTAIEGCAAGIEPTWQTRQAAAAAAFVCVCHRPVAAAASNTARKAALNSNNAPRGPERFRHFMAAILTSN